MIPVGFNNFGSMLARRKALGAISCWGMNQNNGLLIPDLIGTNHGTPVSIGVNPGAYTGGFTQNQTGPWGNTAGGVAYDGSTGYLLTGNLSFTSGPATVEMWIKATSNGPDRRLFSQHSGATNQAGAVGLQEGASDTIPTGALAGSLWVWDGAAWRRLCADGVIATGTWYHVAFVYSSTQCTCYVNGVVQSTATTGFSFNGVAMGFGELYTGSFGSRFSGTIGPCAICSTALTASQIAEHAAAHSFDHWCYLARRDGAISIWPGNETSGTVATDIVNINRPSGPLARAANGGGGVLLNGGYIALPSLSPTSITCEAWIKLVALSNGYSGIISRCAAGGNRVCQYFVKSNGKIAVYVTGASSLVNYDGTGSHTLVVGTWYHVAFTYDSATGIKGYVNGSLDGTAGASGTIVAGSEQFNIGNDTSNAGRVLSGTIGPCAIYFTALTGTQINEQLYQPDKYGC